MSNNSRRVVYPLIVCMVATPILWQRTRAQISDSTSADAESVHFVARSEDISDEDLRHLAARAEDEPADSRETWTLRLRSKHAFLDNRVSGPKTNITLSGQAASGVEAALAVDRDAGEPLYWNPAEYWYGFDHFSGYASIDYGQSRAVVGTYRISFGQGLVLGRGLPPIHSAGNVSVAPRVRSTIRGYAGYSERPVLRGAGIRLYFPHQLEMGVFYSLSRETASMSSTGSALPVVSDLSPGGMHITSSSRERRSRLRMEHVGGWLTVSTNLIRGGLLVLRRNINSDLVLSAVLSDAPRATFSSALAVNVAGWRAAGEVVSTPSGISDAEFALRWRGPHSTLFGEWTHVNKGLHSPFGRSSIFAADMPQSSRLRLGWRTTLLEQRSGWRVSLSSSVEVRQRGVSVMNGLINGQAEPFGAYRRGVRTRIIVGHKRLEWRLTTRAQATPKISESLNSPYHIWISGLSSATGFTARYATPRRLDISMSYRRSRRAVGPEAESRTSGMSMRVSLSGLKYSLAMGETSSFTRSSTEYSGRIPRVYVYENGVRDSFGIVSLASGQSRWFLYGFYDISGWVSLEVKFERTTGGLAELSEVRAARISAPPAKTAITLQATIGLE